MQNVLIFLISDDVINERQARHFGDLTVMEATSFLAEKETQPEIVEPMLATLVKQPFVDDDYVFEVKWDGYRIIARCGQGRVRLQSRGGEDYTRKYPAVVRALETLKVDCIFDGEVVYINDEGKPDFDALQRVNGQKAPVVFYVFDLLWLNGVNVMQQTLLERKKLLKETVAGNAIIKYSDHFDDGVVLFEQVRNMGLEGIVAKRRNSAYIPGERSKKWLKVASEERQEFVIGGWVESAKRNTFRTLLFGAYEYGKLKWKGHAGGGFKEKDMPLILNRLKQLETNESPFDNEVEYSEGQPHWVKPELIANIKFSTLTKSGRIRKPAIFLGFREDKKAAQVVTEIANEPPGRNRTKHEKATLSSENETATNRKVKPSAADSNWPKLESERISNSEVLAVDGCNLRVYNVDRQLWKGVTKADLIQYYNSVSKFILPHLHGRPLSLHIKPKGPNGPGLYIKDMEGREPECARIFTTPRKHKKRGKRDVIDYLVCDNVATLLYVINLGCIDVNPWISTVHDPLHPDFIVIDLDPSDGDFRKAVDTAMAAKSFFDVHKLKAFVKTSGKTGIHLFLPCSGFSYPQARSIAEHMCQEIHRLTPAMTTTAITVSDRGNKLYLDPNQNDYADTVACAYSVRPFKRPRVSTPLEWKELTSSLNPDDFTVHTVVKRLEIKGDLFLATTDKLVAERNNKALSNLF